MVRNQRSSHVVSFFGAVVFPGIEVVGSPTGPTAPGITAYWTSTTMFPIRAFLVSRFGATILHCRTSSEPLRNF